jgi:DNA-binding transcriptional ArsR family regulator
MAVSRASSSRFSSVRAFSGKAFSGKAFSKSANRSLEHHELFSLLAATFQALGDSTRVRIVWALSKTELCVGDIARLLSMSQPAVSHHLRLLRNMRLVKVRREGRISFYQLDDAHISRLLAEGIEHVEDLL